MASSSITGIIYDVERFAIHDGPGIRTTVFFKGCPLSCWWCHNPEGRKPGIEYCERTRRVNGKEITRREAVGRKVTPRELLTEIEKDRAFYEESGGGVTLSGGEPLMQHEFVIGLLRELKKRGIHTALDTCGYADAGVWKKVIPLPDLFLFDLKLMDNALHEQYTGVPVRSILTNLEMLAAVGRKMIIRIPVIPGITGEQENIVSIGSWLTSLGQRPEIRLLPYHGYAKEKYRRMGMDNRLKDLSPPSGDTMNTLKEILVEQGFQVNIGG